MQKKKIKKSWKNHNPSGCTCFICNGKNWMSRLINKTRVRKKFFKYPANYNNLDS